MLFSKVSVLTALAVVASAQAIPGHPAPAPAPAPAPVPPTDSTSETEASPSASESFSATRKPIQTPEPQPPIATPEPKSLDTLSSVSPQVSPSESSSSTSEAASESSESSVVSSSSVETSASVAETSLLPSPSESASEQSSSASSESSALSSEQSSIASTSSEVPSTIPEGPLSSSSATESTGETSVESPIESSSAVELPIESSSSQSVLETSSLALESTSSSEEKPTESSSEVKPTETLSEAKPTDTEERLTPSSSTVEEQPTEQTHEETSTEQPTVENTSLPEVPVEATSSSEEEVVTTDIWLTITTGTKACDTCLESIITTSIPVEVSPTVEGSETKLVTKEKHPEVTVTVTCEEAKCHETTITNWSTESTPLTQKTVEAESSLEPDITTFVTITLPATEVACSEGESCLLKTVKPEQVCQGDSCTTTTPTDTKAPETAPETISESATGSTASEEPTTTYTKTLAVTEVSCGPDEGCELKTVQPAVVCQGDDCETTTYTSYIDVYVTQSLSLLAGAEIIPTSLFPEFEGGASSTQASVAAVVMALVPLFLL